MNTPLLASDEPNTVPSLGTANGTTDPDAESQLTRMLREAPAEDAPLVLRTSSALRVPLVLRPSMNNSRPLSAISFVTIVAGALTLIQTGLLWGSFLSTSWVQTHLIVQPWLSATPLDTVLQVLDLGTIVNAFVSTDHIFEIAMFAIATILIPCHAMIWQPMTILERHSAVVSGQAYKPGSNHVIRFSFLVIFAILLVDTSVAGVQLSLVDTKISVQNEFGPGMWAYTIGCCIAVLVAIVLRLSSVKERSLIIIPTSQDDMEDGYMRVLEEESSVALLETEERASPHLEPHTTEETPTCCFCCSSRLVLFESALLSIAFGIAACVLPLYSVSYEGVAADWMPKTNMTIGVKDFLMANDVLPMIALAQVIVLPVLTFLAAMASCLFGGLVIQQWLAALHTGANGGTLCAAILIMIPSLQSLGDFLLDQQAFCASVQVVTGDSCISLSGSIGPGTWCLLVHAICLEVFVQTTLWRRK